MAGSPLIRAYRYDIPFRIPFRAGTLTFSQRSGILLSLAHQGVQAWSEAAPLPGYSQESLKEVIDLLQVDRRKLTEGLLTWPLERWQAWMEHAELPPSLMFALDGLRADLQAKLHGIPLHRYLNPQAVDRIGINAVIGWTTPQQTYQHAEAALHKGFRTLKFKVVDPTAQIALWTRLKNTYPSLRIRFDANGGWSTAEAATYLELLAPLQPEYLEQPLPVGQERAMADLQAGAQFDLAADESLRSAQEGDQLLKLGAAKVWILKPSLMGSFLALQDLMQKAASHSIRCVVTTSLESGIGRRMIAALVAAFADPALDHGLATGSLLEGDPMPDEHLIRDGYFYPDTVPGIGILPPASLVRIKEV